MFVNDRNSLQIYHLRTVLINRTFFRTFDVYLTHIFVILLFIMYYHWQAIVSSITLYGYKLHCFRMLTTVPETVQMIDLTFENCVRFSTLLTNARMLQIRL